VSSTPDDTAFIASPDESGTTGEVASPHADKSNAPETVRASIVLITVDDPG